LWEYQNFSQTESNHYELKQHKPWFDEECSKLLCRQKENGIAMVAESIQMK
jgi:hypothetical protein